LLHGITSFLTGTLSSLTASILLAVLGGLVGWDVFRATRPHRREGSAKLKLASPSEQAGSVRAVLRPSVVLMAILVSIVTAFSYASSDFVQRSSPGSEAVGVNQGMLRSDARNALQTAQYDADSVLENSRRRAEEVDESARASADRVVEQRIPGALAKKEAAHILALAETEEAQILQDGQKQAQIIIEGSRKESDRLRASADEAESKGPPAPAPTHNGLRDFLENAAESLLFLAFFAAVGRGLGIRGIGLQGVLGAIAIVLLTSIGNGLSGAFGVFNLFGFLLIAAALYAGQTRDISAGEVALSSVSLVCRRFSRALGILIAVWVSTIAVVAVTVIVLALGTNVFQTISDWEFSPPSFLPLWGPVSYGVLSVAIAVFFTTFLANFFAVLGGAAFLSILQGPVKPGSAAEKTPEPAAPLSA
jgi:hypothetical protein